MRLAIVDKKHYFCLRHKELSYKSLYFLKPGHYYAKKHCFIDGFCRYKATLPTA